MGPGDLARRCIAYGVDMGPLCNEAATTLSMYYSDSPMWSRFLRMPKWDKVETLLGAYSRIHNSVEMPDGSDVERALWGVAHETAIFHRNVLYHNDSKEIYDEG